ncbi:MAG: hypothetical protein ABEI98_12000 [Halorhabdus sp.]
MSITRYVSSFSGLVDDVVRNLRGAGFGAVREFVWRTILRYGAELSAAPVLEADWDLLVVLDACRADLWTEVVSTESDLPVGTSRIAPGGTSTEWLTKVFQESAPDALGEIAYVTGNPYSDDYVDGEALAYLDEVWRYGWDDDLGSIPPREITDAAIEASRSDNPDRLIVHYMQPHFPSLVTDRDDGIAVDEWGERSLSVWDDLRFGNRSPTAVWDAYRGNLRLVLDDVRLLLSNVDANRAVITADHGNAFGERGIYGHAAGLALPPLRKVPWAVTSATDQEAYEPTPTHDTKPAKANVTRRLEELGYR